MTAPSVETTTADRLNDSPRIARAIDAIIEELQGAQSSIVSARPPVRELEVDYEAALQRLGETRGRPAFYPYLGSGVGRGPLVELADGSVKWDLISGIGVHMFGHSDPDLAATALRAALSDTVMQGNLQCNQDAVDFSELLLSEAGRTSGLHHCFLTNSGAMANESALKVCMQKREGKAPRILAFADCFMGRSLTMAQIGDSAGSRSDLPLNTLVDYMPFYDPEHGARSIEYAVYHLQQYIERYPGQHACFVMELVQGEGGFNVAPREFFVPLMELSRENGIPIWIDEVQTFGRTQEMFHFEHLGLGPFADVVTIGKMSQICACLFTEEFNPRPGLLSGTFIGSTVGLRTGRRILERLRDGGYYGPSGRIAGLHAAFRERAERLVVEHAPCFPAVSRPRGLSRAGDGLIGGVGGMMRMTPFGGDRVAIVKLLHALFRRGVIAFYCGHGPYHLRFLPPVGVMRPEDFDPVFEIVGSAMAEVA